MRKSLMIVIAAILGLAAVQVLAAPVETGDLLELVQPERAAYLRDSVCTQVSSYDRTGGNDDGFSGKYSYLYKEGNNLVIFDANGPGCIYRLWSADPLDGWVKFYFDGEKTPRLQFEHFRDMFTDKVFPFVPPVSQSFIGGWCSYIPMPFAKSLKIVAGGPVQFLQITWHKFPSGCGIKTFDPNYSQQDRIKLVQVRKAWNNLGQPPTPFPVAAQESQGTITVAPGETGGIIGLEGAGLIRAIHMKPQCGDAKYGRKALLLMNVDGLKKPNIYAPIADFFLDPFGGEKCQSMLIGKDKDSYYSYWVMPYASGASIRVKNEAAKPLKLTYDVVYEPMEKLPEGMGRFFAWWHRQNPTIRGEEFPILEATGRGQYGGVSHAMEDDRNGIGFLEGDEKMVVDERNSSFYNGTGTEDYFNGGWYFAGATGSAPFYGDGVREDAGRVHAYRFQMTDCVPFQEFAKIGIEHGPQNDWISDYAGVTYWYAEPGTKHTFKPVPMLDRLVRHQPQVDVTEAESAYLRNSGGKLVNDANEPFSFSSAWGVATHGKVGDSFNLQVDLPEDHTYNFAIALAKGPDRGIAEVSVDGKVLGQTIDTYSKESEAPARIQVGSPTLTKGKHTITVKAVGENTASTGAGVLADYLVMKK